MNEVGSGAHRSRAVRLTAPVGVVVGFAVSTGMFLGPVGWAGAAILLGAFSWLVYRTSDRGLAPGSVLLGAGGVLAGVGLYVALALVQGISGSPPADSGSGSAAFQRAEDRSWDE